LLFVYYVIGGLYSEDVRGWISEINAKHYWLTLPLMWGTLPPRTITIQRAWWAFVVANLLVAMMVIWIHWTGQPLWEGTAKIPAPFVQRPRASLFLAMAILWLVHAGKLTPKYFTIPGLALCLIGLIWMEGRIGQAGLVIGMAQNPTAPGHDFESGPYGSGSLAGIFLCSGAFQGGLSGT
jgi:hypothetical protein